MSDHFSDVAVGDLIRYHYDAEGRLEKRYGVVSELGAEKAVLVDGTELERSRVKLVHIIDDAQFLNELRSRTDRVFASHPDTDKRQVRALIFNNMDKLIVRE